MSLFSSKGSLHIEGHKELTKHEEVISLREKVKKVYFPTMSPNGKPITFSVQPGDKVKVGTKIGARTDFEVPVYSSVSGTVAANENIYSPQIGRAIPHVVIENDGNYEEEEPLKTVSLDSTKEEIVEAIKASGLVGMGGAGFPTYVKYSGTATIHTVLVNGIECEPYLTTDFVTMQNRVDDLLAGAELLMKASGANKAIIAIKKGKEEVRDAINAKLGEHPNITVQEVKDVYPMGWERVLIRTIFHKEYDRLPAEVGVVVNNGQTVIEIGRTLLTGKVVSERLVTVSGRAIAHPTNVMAPIGTLASELVEACGGITEEVVNFIPGGPMCTKAVNTTNFPILIQTGSLTCIKYHQYEAEACLRCGTCSMHCPANLQPVELKIAAERRDVKRMKELHIMDCIECGMCSMVCPSHCDVTETIKKGKVIVKLQSR